MVTVNFPLDNNTKEKPFEITLPTKPVLKVIEKIKDEITGEIVEVEVAKDIKAIEESFESKFSKCSNVLGILKEEE